MSLRIGLDFDNTLACYDLVFAEAARGQKIISELWTGNKRELRDYIRTLDDGELLWQKIQGKVYGKYMNKASLFPGVAEFLWKCKVKNAEIFIVSHKTEYGHFDEEKINLREAALEWMRQQQFFNPNEFGILEANVSFAHTRTEKVNKINDLDLSYFIDDLIEVFEEKNFSEKTKKVLFSNSKLDESALENLTTATSWKKISEIVFSDITALDILSILKLKWKELDLREINIIKASGNSRVYKLVAFDKSYILKVYPDLQLDPRERLKTEYTSSERLSAFGLPVPKPICKDEKLNWAIYSWIDGNEIGDKRDGLISQLLNFIDGLQKLKKEVALENFSLASEACLSGAELESQLLRRLNALRTVDNTDLLYFLDSDLQPLLNTLLEKAKSNFLEEYNKNLEKHYWTLSPSDFGFHNSKLDEEGMLFIYDLEYFGWDDPVKLISDFLWHPGMNLTLEEKMKWKKECLHFFIQDKSIEKRFNLYYPLYGIRWCLILLNEFLKAKLENRINADPDKKEKLSYIKNIQLEKSKALLEKIKSII